MPYFSVSLPSPFFCLFPICLSLSLSRIYPSLSLSLPSIPPSLTLLSFLIVSTYFNIHNVKASPYLPLCSKLGASFQLFRATFLRKIKPSFRLLQAFQATGGFVDSEKLNPSIY
jgi:hypothetical protein